jgi:thymidine kinase
MVYLKVILGCMFSSKTSTLLSEINRYKHITDKILVVNSVLDKERQSNNSDSIIESHDLKHAPAVIVSELYDLKKYYYHKQKYDYAEIIIIDEGQFYSDLYIFIREELFSQTNKKMFIVAGLSGDYNMEPIGDMIKLIPMADEILKLSAYCIYCKDGTLAHFTSKLSNDTKQILVGKNDLYSPCCRSHYLTFLKNK